MEKIIHFTVPEKISPVQTGAIERARKLHPAWEIKVWRDPIQPAGFLLERYWPKVNSGAQLADLLRLDILYRYGGVYVDSDLMLLKPLDELADHFEFFVASEDGRALTNALFAARKESPVVRSLIDALIKNEPDWTLGPQTTTGPHMFSNHLRWRKDVTVLPRETFYTYNWDHEGERKNHRHSYGEHLWVASWKPEETKHRPQPKPNVLAHVGRFLKSYLKSAIRQAAIAGFHYWRRLKSLDKADRSSSAKSYPCAEELVVQTIHGFKIIVDGRDISVTPDLVLNGFHELAEENFLNRTVQGGDWVVDVGSNIGSISLLAARKVGAFGRVFSFEPSPRPMNLMAKSAVMNRVHDRIVARPIAVGEEPGTVKLTILPDSLGGLQFDQSDVAGSAMAENVKFLGQNQKTVLDVPCTNLDTEFPVNLPIKVLKIDVGGYEGHVLAGGKRLLQSRCVDFIMMELLEEIASSRWHDTVTQVQAVIDYGYTVCTLTEDGERLEHKNLTAAIQTGNRNIVLAAHDQYTRALAGREY